MNAPMEVSRRAFLQAGGALVISFAIPLDATGQAPSNPALEQVDAFLSVAADGRVHVFIGKVELGTGIETAMAQLAADELDVSFGRISMVMGDTQLCPDQGPTVGSLTIYRAGPQLRQAAAEARATLLAMASARLGVPASELAVQDGVVSASGGRQVSYADLVGGRKFEKKLERKVQPKQASQQKVIGQSVPRVDIPAKVYGTHPYVQNLRVEGMLHGRVVRSPMIGAKVAKVDAASVAKLPGNVRVVQKGNFVGVVADTEHAAIRAARTLKVEWTPGPAVPDMAALPAALRQMKSTERVLQNEGKPAEAMAAAAKRHRASYYVPHQLHASIGPSCAVANVGPNGATLWSPTQSSFLLRDSVATLVGLPKDKVRLIWMEGSGCYGHNGADDCTGDAALLSQAVGKPVRLQWMRHDEHLHEPKGVAMAFEVSAGLDAQGAITAWDYQVWSPNHSGRPSFGAAGNIIPGLETGMAERHNVVGPDRNARPTYVFPNKRVALHLLEKSPIRVSSLRGLGSPQNTFANESFIDEMAAQAGADPIAFRLRHLKDPRAIAVMEAVARLAKWDARPAAGEKRGRGRGAAFVQYDNYSAYVGMVVHVEVDRASGKVRVPRVYVAHDCGLIVNPDGLRNQIEGAVVQTLSRALVEDMRFDAAKFLAPDWNAYPILKFSDAPEEIVIELINRPELPALGGGEPAASPVIPAVANAIFDATGVRLRSVPFLPARLKAALA